MKIRYGQEYEKNAKIEELKQLRSELDTNRKYVFERPLIIIAGTFAALGEMYKVKAGFGVLLLIYPCFLIFNLLFTFNRLKSNSRIIGYLQIVHSKNGIGGWIGWEEALNRHRLKMKECRNAQIKKCDEAISFRFYNLIFWFHLIFAWAGTAMISMAFLGLNESTNQYADICIIIVTIAILLFSIIPFWLSRPSLLFHDISQNRKIWKSVAHEGDNLSGGEE